MSEVRTRIEKHIRPFLPEMVATRRAIHAYPELAFEERHTGELVAGFLARWDYDVATGIGKTGVVGTLRAGSSTRSIGIRADMDALPIQEETELPYASSRNGTMHACGHDGHTAILLTAARYLTETKNFDGTVHLIFQPAEEGKGGAKAMIEDGLFKRFPCDAVYGLHNWPGLASGQFAFRDGPVLASSDKAIITVRGIGGHGAMPHLAKDPIACAAALVSALQTVVSRNVSPLETAVVTVGFFHAGSAVNIIPETATLGLTIRALTPEVRDLLQERVTYLARHTADSFGMTAQVEYERSYPVTVNSSAETELAMACATAVFGAQRTSIISQHTGAEDFAFMLEKVPGSYLVLGNGDSLPLHNPKYDFNDDIILPAATLWGALVETCCPAGWGFPLILPQAA